MKEFEFVPKDSVIVLDVVVAAYQTHQEGSLLAQGQVILVKARGSVTDTWG